MKLLAVLFCIALYSFVRTGYALDNGLALTPPMGWMDWERFRCNIDCEHDPHNCISEHLFMEIADRMAEDGYRGAGYEFISIDDCYTNKKRDKNGNLQLNTTRFPSGPHALAQYIHGKGLKLGVYADYGVLTCAGYPGSYYYIEQDAKTFASWGADYLKLDGCYSDPKTMNKGYPEFRRALNATGRLIVYSCEWPSYMIGQNLTVNYTDIAENCNTWRNYDDIQDSWASVMHIVDYFAANQDTFIAAAGPGHWNDPDELIIGNFGLSDDQSRAQMALWAIMASPLIMSTDLRSIKPRHKEILLNKEVIAVNQDKLGKMGRQWIKSKDNTEVWARPLSDGSVAVVLLNRRDDGMPYLVEASFDKIGFQVHAATARDLFSHKHLGSFINSFAAHVNPTGVVMVKLTKID
ncbi:alpha-N-acetylgalactosaminidase [Nematostella vectensis]|uniref:alpha-N-acetylgalactosaminidase n=1 Tax=Nematostella vectensis TaxID=45351 RepID=UPI002077337F|nr:alpha-N-acetylgalactosaminidase [Nematostella vectensis]